MRAALPMLRTCKRKLPQDKRWAESLARGLGVTVRIGDVPKRGRLSIRAFSMAHLITPKSLPESVEDFDLADVNLEEDVAYEGER